MKRWLWLPVGLACVGVVAWLGVARGQGTWFDSGPIMSNGWAYEAEPVGPVLSAPRVVTGYAFGPGRSELAFCGPTGERSAVWVVSVEPLLTRIAKLRELMGKAQHGRLTSEEQALLAAQDDPLPNPAQPRLLWTAPAGTALRGPIWWAPNGGTILVRAGEGEQADLMAVDYISGEATRLVHGTEVAGVAWSPSGKQFAYVAQEGESRLLRLQPFPNGETTQLGEGGYNLRWTTDGKALRWYAPASASAWTEMEWEAESREAKAVGSRPARPPGAIWSPDGRWCAALEGEGTAKQTVIYPVGSSKGESIALPGLKLEKLLAWSPDSNLLLVLDDRHLPFAINVTPPPREELLIGHDSGGSPKALLSRKERAVLAGLPLEVEAGDPTWTSDGGALVYAVARDAKGGPEWMGEAVEEFGGNLLLSVVQREYVHLEPVERAKLERNIVTANTKNVAIAFNMYLADYDAFPLLNGQAEMMATIEDYVKNSGLFMRPGSKDEIVVRWVFDPTMSLRDIEDAARLEVAIIDYHPDFYVVAYVDGHVRAFDKKKP